MSEVATRPENARELTTESAGLPLAVRAAEAVEPVPAGSGAPPCANCDTALAGPFCSQCGQHDKDYHRSLWRFFSDFLDNTFCWDNKFLLTVKPLVRQPGFLTQEFMAGHRVRYVHPLRMFLFTSAVCLALIGFINHHLEHAPGLIHMQVGPSGKEQKGIQFHFGTDGKKAAAHPAKDPAADADEDDDTRAAPAASASPAVTGQTDVASPAAADPSFAAKLEQVLAASAAKNPGAAASVAPTTPPGPTPGQTASSTDEAAGSGGKDPHEDTMRQVRQALRDGGLLPSGKAKAGAKDGASKGGVPDAEAINAKIDAALTKGDAALASADRMRAQRIGAMVGKSFDSVKAGRIAEEISRGVEQKLSWVALALLPVFALLLRAVYWREDSYYFTHFVYSLHYHTFLFLFWVAYACAGVVAEFLPFHGLWSFLLGLCLLLPGWYLFLSLRRMYGDSPRRTAAKVVVIGVLHLLAILIGVASVGALAFFSAGG